MKKIIYNGFLIMACAAIVAAGGCKKKMPIQAGQDVVHVRASAVERRDISEALDYTGGIKGKDEAYVFAKVSGKVVSKVKAEGDTIAKGDPIVFLDRDETGLQYAPVPIESPLDGVVGRIVVDVGAYVTPQDPIAFVVSMDTVKVALDIPEKYVPRLARGLRASAYVDAYPEKSFEGLVTSVSPVVTAQTRAAPIEITFDNPGHLLQSGMFCRVELILNQRAHALTLMREAVIGSGDNTHVFVVVNGKAVLRPVATGIRQDGFLEIREGLAEGERVVVMGQQMLTDGTSVVVEE